MRILYFVPALDDPVLARRIRMLKLGGAEVDLIGFRRGAQPVDQIEGVVPSGDLGQTYEGRLGSRAISVLSKSLRAREWKPLVDRADLILARNLEMATIADAARVWAMKRPLAYEVLDIHSSLHGQRLSSKALRQWERHILGRSDGLIVSSAAFVTSHFCSLGCKLPPVILIENKRITSAPDIMPLKPPSEVGPPWKIGWYGLLRCEKSFNILYMLAASYPRLVEIEMRGIPADSVQRLISSRVSLPNMRFLGAYQQIELPAIYSNTHFIWAIDYYQQGLNSDWLLPNRLYDSLLFGTPVLARTGTETARWLGAREVGLVLDDPNKDLPVLMSHMTTVRYGELRKAVEVVPREDLVHTVEECWSIVDRLAQAADDAPKSSPYLTRRSLIQRRLRDRDQSAH